MPYNKRKKIQIDMSLLRNASMRPYLPVDMISWSQMTVLEKQEWMESNGSGYVRIRSNAEIAEKGAFA